MPDICLVSAPTETDLEDECVLERENSGKGPRDYPLGVLTLAAELEQQAFIPQVVDLNRWYIEFLLSAEGSRGRNFTTYSARRLAELDCPIIGFSTICSSYPLTVLIAEQLKKLRPDTLVLAGGPQASVVDTATLQHFPFIDLIVRGEADHSLPALLAALKNGDDIGGLSGITYRKNGQVVRASESALVSNLDLLPSPAFHLYPGMKSSRVLPLEHGRGCPFSCTFCSTNDFFRRRFRLKSSAKMMQEMDILRERYGVEYFDLMHDMFTVDRRRVVEFCEAVLVSGKKYLWGCSARTDCVDEELLELMARAGCVSIFYGVETGSVRMQSIIDKELDIAEASAKVRLSADHGMKTVASMIIGYPEETSDDLRATLNFMGESMRNNRVDPHLHLLAPLPGTPLYHRYRKELVLEDLPPDMSHNRLSHNPVERNLITNYPDLFPNFYSIPTPNLERGYLHELREFFIRAMRRFRWLLVAWHDRCGDLLALFDEWKQWKGRDKGRRLGFDQRRYYCTSEFDRNFIEFLSHRPGDQRSPFENVLLEFERALTHSLVAQDENRSEAIVFDTVSGDMRITMGRGVHFLRLSGNFNRVVALLRQGKTADDSIHQPESLVVQTIPDSDEVEIVPVSSAVAEFLSLCDGHAMVDEVLERFAMVIGDCADVPAAKVALHALRTLHQRKLISFLSSRSFLPYRAAGAQVGVELS